MENINLYKSYYCVFYIMKKDIVGIILAGGLGTRIGKKIANEYRVTTNKHLVQILDRPMIDYPIMLLLKAGIKDIIIVTGPEYAEHFYRGLKFWDKFGVKIVFLMQEKALGIADALRQTEIVVNGRKMIVILGDNFFEDDISETVKKFRKSNSSYVFLKKVLDSKLYEIHEDPRQNNKPVKRARFGIAEVRNNKIFHIEEKPINPKTNLVVTGLYFYMPDVFEIIKKLKPSWRGEYEISDVNQSYVDKKKLGYFIVRGFWSDMGTCYSKRKVEDFLISKLSPEEKEKYIKD